MNRDFERVERIRQALREEGLDGLICALPTNALLLSGYWPVMGLSVVMATREGRILVVAPEDEKELAEQGWEDGLRTYAAASLQELRSPVETVRQPLAKAAATLKLGPGSVIGYENDEASVPAPYVAMHLYGAAVAELLRSALPGVTLAPASELLRRLRAVLTPSEVNCVRTACHIGAEAFETGAELLQAGMTEPEAVNAFRAPLSANGQGLKEVARADGAVWCMSGPNSAEAYTAFARTRARTLELGDLAMIHCNSFVDGYWTDITRTYCLGPPSERQKAMYDAVLAARQAALEAIRPSARAAEVDHAAREVLEQRGFGKAFKHPTGHGVGFAAISANARPRLHPASPDVLETGMVFNVEPAVYLEGYGGIRHCDVVTVTDTGAEVLTPFQAELDELVII